MSEKDKSLFTFDDKMSKNRKLPWKLRENYSLNDLETAVATVKDGTMTAYKAAKQFSIPEATIYTNIKVVSLTKSPLFIFQNPNKYIIKQLTNHYQSSLNFVFLSACFLTHINLWNMKKALDFGKFCVELRRPLHIIFWSDEQNSTLFISLLLTSRPLSAVRCPFTLLPLPFAASHCSSIVQDVALKPKNEKEN